MPKLFISLKSLLEKSSNFVCISKGCYASISLKMHEGDDDRPKIIEPFVVTNLNLKHKDNCVPKTQINSESDPNNLSEVVVNVKTTKDSKPFLIHDNHKKTVIHNVERANDNRPDIVFLYFKLFSR